jgi:hypothetical protein
VRAAFVALAAGAVFLAGVLFGSTGSTTERPIRPVVLTGSTTAAGGEGSQSVRNVPAPGTLDVHQVERDVEEGSVEDYGDEYEDNSGPGSDDSGGDNSGSGSDDSGSGSDDSGSGSDGSGSGSDNSGSGSHNSGSGSGSSGSESSGSGSG